MEPLTHSRAPRVSIVIAVTTDGSTDPQSRKALYRGQSAFDECEIVAVEAADLCASRNAGLDKASGEFVLFDDLSWTPGASDLAELLAAGLPDVDTPEADVVRCVPEGDPADGSPFTPLRASVVGTLFRRDVLTRHGLRFPEGDGVHPMLAELTIGAPALVLARRIGVAPSPSAPAATAARVGAALDDASRDADAHEQQFELLAELDRLRDWLPAAAGLDLMMARIAMRFAVRASQVLSSDRLREHFDRLVQLFGPLTPAAVLAVSADIRNRLPFVAFCTGDFELYVAGAVDPSCVVVAGKRLRFELGLDASWHEVLTAQRVECFLDGIRIDAHRRRIVISGNVRLPGVDLSRPHPLQLAVRLHGAAGTRTYGAAVDARNEISAIRPKELYSAFRRAIDVERIGAGVTSVRVVIKVGTERITQAALPTAGYLKSARDLRVGAAHVLATTTDEGWCRLLVGTGSAREWRRTLRAEDARHIKARGPMWRERRLRLLTRAWYRRKRIWVIAERPDTAQDNGAVLFRHLRENHPEIDAYYVIDRNSPHRARLAGLDHVVAHSSSQHVRLMLHARLLITAYDIDYFMLPRHWDREHYARHLAWRVGARRAYLQHGVTYNDVGPALNRGNKGVDLFLSVSEAEQAYLRERTRYTREVQALGFPRFDRLRPRTAPTGRILFMPTWRRYLVAPSYDPTRGAIRSLTGSAYERFLQDFLNSPTLRAELGRHDAVLEVIPHYEIARRAADLFAPSDRIVFPEGRDIQAAINECDLLVTDWSSVFFDAAYRGIPVITAPFDEAQFRAGHYAAGYFDLRRDGMGPAVETAAELVERTVFYMDNGYLREPEYERRSAEFFVHRDAANCERVTGALMKLG